jgi:hypothetical protein
MFKVIFLLLLISFTCSFQGRLYAQQSIRITVQDEQKNALPGASVYLLNKDSVAVSSQVANADGS